MSIIANVVLTTTFGFLRRAQNMSYLSLVFLLVSNDLLALEEVGMNLGSGITFFSSISVNHEQNSNVYRRHSNEVSSEITRLTPSFALVKDTGQTFIQASYQLEKGLYSVDSANDYLDQLLSLHVDEELNAYHRLDADMTYELSHYEHGSGVILGSVDANKYDLEAYNQFNTEFGYGIGSIQSSINARTYVRHYGKIYEPSNIPDIKSINYYINLIGSHIRLFPEKRIGFASDIEYSKIGYYEDAEFGNSRTGSNIRILSGMEWKFTNFTTGELKVGVAKRNFDRNKFDDSKFRPVWQVQFTWLPMDYTKITALTAAENIESVNRGSHIEKSRTKFDVEHGLTALLTAQLSVEYITDEFIQSSFNNSGNIKIELLIVGAKIAYSPVRWADVELYVSRDAYTSNREERDYQTHTIGVGLELVI